MKIFFNDLHNPDQNFQNIARDTIFWVPQSLGHFNQVEASVVFPSYLIVYRKMDINDCWVIWTLSRAK